MLLPPKIPRIVIVLHSAHSVPKEFIQFANPYPTPFHICAALCYVTTCAIVKKTPKIYNTVMPCFCACASNTKREWKISCSEKKNRINPHSCFRWRSSCALWRCMSLMLFIPASCNNCLRLFSSSFCFCKQAFSLSFLTRTASCNQRHHTQTLFTRR